MKTTINFPFIYMLLLCMAITTNTNAQQLANKGPVNQLHNGQVANNLTARIFLAPNNTYGYDILSNGKLIYHHPAFSGDPAEGYAILTKKEHADLAATITLDKIRRGENPELTVEELKKINTP